MLQLPSVTIWTIVWANDRKWIIKAGQVLRYCGMIIKPARFVLFTHEKLAAKEYPWDTVQIPELNWQSYNIFVNRVVPTHLKSDYAMSVHEDGFPLDVSLWDSRFLDYDYIGAPWDDGQVGNGGFNIESRKLMDLKCAMPVLNDEFSLPSDRLVCTARKSYLEERGVRFAPRDLALQFSTEQVGRERPSFGFHGRGVSAAKYAQGWAKINAMPVEIRGGMTMERNRVVKVPRQAALTPMATAPTPTALRAAMKICITTTFNKAYALGGATMIQSVKRHTDCTGIDFRVITDDPLVVKEFGAENCHVVTDEIKARYANVKYSPELPKERYHNSWYRYEMFSFEGYDRVICIDSDCICIEDISYLFGADLDQYDLVSVEDHIVSKCFTKSVKQLESQGLRFAGLRRRLSHRQIDIQPALLVANKSIVNKAWYERLLRFANASGFTYSIDEGILNDFVYDNKLKVCLLPLEWDYQDLYEIHCPTLPVPKRPIIVHCQESKPFLKEKSALDRRMHKWHDRWWRESRGTAA